MTVFGWWYYGGRCNDVGAPGDSSSPRPTGAAVQLRLTTSDGATRPVATATPGGPEATFAATVVVPADAPAGPARISDGQGNVVTLTVAQQ